MKPINLNKARKARARAETRAQADQNAVTFGRSKAERNANKLDTEKTNRTVDNAKRDR